MPESITPVVVLESDGAGIPGLNIGGHGMFFQNFPFVSTDRARLALQVRNNSNDTKWFFASGYFSIRHDSRLGFQPPSRRSQVARWRRVVSRRLDRSDLLDSQCLRRSALVRYSGVVRLRPHMAPNRERSPKHGDQLRLATTTINGDS